MPLAHPSAAFEPPARAGILPLQAGVSPSLPARAGSSRQRGAFAPTIASNFDLALDAAGWYWQRLKINKYADDDNIEKVSAAVNYPKLLTEKVFNSANINGLQDRKKFYLLMKKVFNYENCKK